MYCSCYSNTGVLQSHTLHHESLDSSGNPISAPEADVVHRRANAALTTSEADVTFGRAIAARRVAP
jgi:hypothetical protein